MRALREPVTVIFALLFAPAFIGCMGLIFGNNPVPEFGGKGFLEAIQALAGTLASDSSTPGRARSPMVSPSRREKDPHVLAPRPRRGRKRPSVPYQRHPDHQVRLHLAGPCQRLDPADGLNGWQVAILVAAYAPMLLLWAPALTIGLIGYWRRRTTR